jgi:hypothetical protein
VPTVTFYTLEQARERSRGSNDGRELGEDAELQTNNGLTRQDREIHSKASKSKTTDDNICYNDFLGKGSLWTF